jgi:ABC-type glycerol-3-phosphate transport system permease component
MGIETVSLDDLTTAIVFLIVVVFYIPLIFILKKSFIRKASRKEYYRAFLSVLDRVDDDEEVVDQMTVIFKKISERHGLTSSGNDTATDYSEDLLCRVESYRHATFKFHYSIEFTPEHKGRIVNVIRIMKARQPFGSLSSKYGNLLSMIKHAFDTSNDDLGVSNLRQLAEDIELMESTIHSQGKKNLIATSVSVVGVVLTIVFGALTVIQFVYPPVG